MAFIVDLQVEKHSRPIRDQTQKSRFQCQPLNSLFADYTQQNNFESVKNCLQDSLVFIDSVTIQKRQAAFLYLAGNNRPISITNWKLQIESQHNWPQKPPLLLWILIEASGHKFYA